MEKITFKKDGETVEVDSTNQFAIAKLTATGWVEQKK